ncbi:MAG: hypothetical protein ABMB14_24115 [Myxococcota bacterium]
MWIPLVVPFVSPSAMAAADCALSEADYYALRRDLRDLRRSEGASIGVAAEGAQCGRALEAVIRNGPFLGVHRASGAPDQCTAVIRPAASDGHAAPPMATIGGVPPAATPAARAGYTLEVVGDCHSDLSGPSRFVSIGYWLPFGGSVRWDQQVSHGLSVVIDGGWQAVGLDAETYDLGSAGEPVHDPEFRGLAGFDLSRDGLRGGYVGVRAGAEWIIRAGSLDNAIDAGSVEAAPSRLDPNVGIVSFVLGQKWISNGVGFQIGGGLSTEIPLGLGPQPAWVTPVLELRGGLANRR